MTIASTPKSLLMRYLLAFLLIETLTRCALGYYAWSEKQLELASGELLKIFGFGVISDSITFVYFALPFLLISLVLPHKLHQKYKDHIIYKSCDLTLLFAWVFTLCFTAFSEVTFWDEFGSRFNFIAVDYLVYTNEVILNIVESYPILPLILATILCSLIILAITVYCFSFTIPLNWITILSVILLFAGTFNFYDNKITDIKANNYSSELAKNGIYNLFSAFRNNSLSYNQFYSQLPIEEAVTNVRTLIRMDSQRFLSDLKYSLARTVISGKPDKEMNVVLITVESLSAEFMQSFGNEQALTPFLDSLAKESIFFTNFFATGTRTVRGLEAIALSIPPTAGSSIVRRPDNEGLFSIGTIFKDHKYDTQFLYGGYGYFDNMNYFFSNNDFRIVDRMTIDKSNITFANVWGVADGDLYDQALREADKSYSEKKKFFQWVMTTTNHRPFTYPAGKIDIPSGTNRAGGVKYTDYAIEDFITKAKTKPWFANTIFVITADHCASSAGKLTINPEKYHIPLLIYSPGNITPQIVTQLSSQIDLAPTIFGLLNFNYISKFFGNDILNNKIGRAFIGTYQLLGYMEQGPHQPLTTLPQRLSLQDHKFVVLGPKQQNEIWSLNAEGKRMTIGNSEKILMRAISNYQAADYLFHQGYMKND
jgi:phosphoglycerol transferase MdoB-like AlkP superfamily enzyme